MTEADFSILIEQIKNDDPRGMREVYTQTNRYCLGTLIKKTSCKKEDAEDLYMDALLVFRENILGDKVAYMSNIQTYMFGICYNLWRDFNRSQNKWKAAETEVERQYLILKGEESDEEAMELVKAKCAKVIQALEQLGDKCKRLLTYAYVEQRSQQEIAETMGFASANVVKVTRFRCYKKWMEILQHEK